MPDKPYWPATDIKVERALGRFIIAWGVLEREFDSVIHDLLLTSLHTSALVTANLAIRGKLDLAHALFEDFRSDDPPHLIAPDDQKEFDDLINKTAHANSESRIPIVHGQPMALNLESGTRPLWIKAAARKGGFRGRGQTYSKESLEAHTSQVANLVERWAALRKRWKSAITGSRLADADKLLGGSPGDEDHLILQIQSNPGSPKPKPKQSRKRPSSSPPKVRK